MDLTDLARRLIPCPRCEALPGAGCTTVTGARARYVHAPRTRPVYDAWRIGYSEGLSDTLGTAERTLRAGHTLEDLIRDTRLRLEVRAPVR